VGIRVGQIYSGMALFTNLSRGRDMTIEVARQLVMYWNNIAFVGSVSSLPLCLPNLPFVFCLLPFAFRLYTPGNLHPPSSTCTFRAKNLRTTSFSDRTTSCTVPHAMSFPW
jgi:hypothetical protein